MCSGQHWLLKSPQVSLPPEISPSLWVCDTRKASQVLPCRGRPHIPAQDKTLRTLLACLYPLRNLTQLRVIPAPHLRARPQDSLTALIPKPQSPQQAGRASPAPPLQPQHCAVQERPGQNKAHSSPPQPGDLRLVTLPLCVAPIIGMATTSPD